MRAHVRRPLRRCRRSTLGRCRFTAPVVAGLAAVPGARAAHGAATRADGVLLRMDDVPARPSRGFDPEPRDPDSPARPRRRA